MIPLCRDFAKGTCKRAYCKFSHDIDPSRVNPPPKHKHHPRRKVRNTESFEPLAKPVDMRILFDNGHHTSSMSTVISTRDVVLVPNLFTDFGPGDIYQKLVQEIKTCGVPQDKLLKLWHGDTHLICDDHTPWKKNAPTFHMILNRIRTFFNMNIQATRLNWYQDTSHWKPFHFDSAAVNEDKARIQNFTVAVSFGATRDVAFEDAKTKVVISIPQPDGTIYAFAKDTNCLWRHGILKEKTLRNDGRISVIAWGWIDEMITDPL